MIESYKQPLHLGMIWKTQPSIKTFQAKPEEGKTTTSIKPGDVVVLTKGTGDNIDTLYVEKATSTNIANKCILGVATSAIYDFVVPVLMRGWVVANIDSKTFTDIAIGKHIGCKGQNTGCCGGLLVEKIKAKKPNGTLMDAYVIQL